MNELNTDTQSSEPVVDQTSPQTQGAPVTAEAQAQAQAAMKRYLAEGDMDALVKVKVDGEVMELPLKEVIKNQQLAKTSNKRLQEAAQAQKQIQQLAKLALDNPKEYFKLLNKDPYSVAEEWLSEKVERELMSPEQRELMEAKRELEQYKAIEKQKKDEELRLQNEKEENQVRETVDRELAEAFQNSKLPRHTFFVKMAAATKLSAEKQGIDLPWDQTVARVEKTFLDSQLPEILGLLPVEVVAEKMGSAMRRKLREFELSQLNAKTSNGKSTSTVKTTREEKNQTLPWHERKPSKKPMGEKEYREYMEKLRSQEQ